MLQTNNGKKSGIVLLVAVSGILLGACAHNPNKAQLRSLDGACNAFPKPVYQVKGKTPYDQQWADEVTEAGVAGCQWKRPAKRPAALDAPKAKKAPVVKESKWKRAWKKVRGK